VGAFLLKISLGGGTARVGTAAGGGGGSGAAGNSTASSTAGSSTAGAAGDADVLVGLAATGASWIPSMAFGAVWLAVAAITRYSSLAALIASAATPAVLWATDDRQEAQLFLLLTVLVFVMHRENIARLIGGTEGKIGFGRNKAR